MKKNETSLAKRKELLGIEDFDYFSARLLLLSGLATSGFPLASQATEKELKKYSHNLLGLFDYMKKRVNVNNFSSNQFDPIYSF